MSNSKGWIKVQRKLFKHYLWEENRKLSKFEAWLDLLQLVSYAKENQQLISGLLCKWGRGQYPISISFLCKRWNWTDKPVRNFLKMLEYDEMITLEKASKWTMLTVCKYDSYQGEGQAEGMPKGKQRATIKEDKESKEYKEFELFWSKYPRKVAKGKCQEKFNKLSTSDKQQILDSLDAYIKYKPFEGYNHPNPETYLNQKRWLDELPNKQTIIEDPVVKMAMELNKKYENR